MSANKIMYIFIYQGIFLGIVGIIFGLILGVLLSLNLDIVVSFIENILGRSILDSDIYMISDVPAKLEFLDLIYVSIISFFFSQFLLQFILQLRHLKQCRQKFSKVINYVCV